MIPDMTENDKYISLDDVGLPDYDGYVKAIDAELDKIDKENKRLKIKDIAVQKRMDILNGMFNRSVEENLRHINLIKSLRAKVENLTTEVDELKKLRQCGNCRLMYCSDKVEPCLSCVNASKWVHQ